MDQSPRPPKYAPRQLTTPRAAALAGLVFAALFVASLLVTRSVLNDTGASGEFRASLTGSIVASYLIPFTGIAFLWFIGVVRDRVGLLEDRFFATVFLGSGVLFVSMLFSAASMLAALLVLSHPSGELTALASAMATSMFYLYGARTAGVFTIVTSTIVLRTGALPRWAALIGFAIGLVLLLSVQAFDLAILFFPAWVALLSVVILMSHPAGPVSD